MLVTVGLPISIQFMSGNWFIRQITCLEFRYISSGFHCDGNVRGKVPTDFIRSVANDIRRAMRKIGGGRAGSCRRRKYLRGCACGIILTQNLLHQAKDRSRVPFQLPVPQRTGETISVDHAGVRPHGRDCDPAVEPTTYLCKGLPEFFCYESNQIHEYD